MIYPILYDHLIGKFVIDIVLSNEFYQIIKDIPICMDMRRSTNVGGTVIYYPLCFG